MTDIVTLIVVTRELTREIRLHEHQVAYWTKVWVDAGHTVTRK